ncbi:GNAT family N-acetyltransferase [Streptomyces spinosirectus]|jgi:lipid II:glycine glycyltransferase (peptidoglycan interpeptide bridge formation enzyme)|uniref:lipid II:glycine glycyltransferase FemX n=1 Tax=Streptomyces TaxID=1883 RepID=UPI000D362683|nr:MULTISPECIES: GNAT family N-acetyltransferase [Streptomyces]MBY8338499.1 GNAT family N-acetyltransferase [Streptomyces plumbidurans]PTM96818.1 acetyltransferase (GNAT) family protein [Streptomyces sp. VMFN-G11Ma]UIR16381.1 GNAT family N-acetyltransferase [Streptomyces spinosirectus]
MPDGRGEVSVTVSSRPPPEVLADWDRLVDGTRGGDVAQLSAWAAVRREAGYTPRYVLARHAGRLVGGALVLQRALPLLGTVGYVSHGPLIAPGPAQIAAVEAVGDELTRLGHGLAGLFVQPPYGADDVAAHLLGRGFRPSTAGVSPAASVRVDLTGDLKDVLARIRPSNRRSIRGAARRGITVRAGGEDDLPLAAGLLAESAAHHRFEPLSLGYLRVLYRELARDGHVRMFVAELKGVPAAMILCTGCAGTLTGRLVGMRGDAEVRRADVVRQADWHAIVWAKRHGYRDFDFGGLPADLVDPIRRGADDLAARLTGPARYKLSFGGEPFRYPQAVELISSRLLRNAYDWLRGSGSGGRLLVNAARRLMRGGAERRTAPKVFGSSRSQHGQRG